MNTTNTDKESLDAQRSSLYSFSRSIGISNQTIRELENEGNLHLLSDSDDDFLEEINQDMSKYRPVRKSRRLLKRKKLKKWLKSRERRLLRIKILECLERGRRLIEASEQLQS
ncbi:DgyrCDS9237 [Dimorphilus gyrociliatus]|uniref:DgyrCDS9237 n=1 Tax=Dimorphilus gyrociliatus TaxID=2664684 RepID=A0A7I8VWR9_9ANNE|nr:DgyrCDS9237 [Dimorphilus gyrociliatus]